MPDQEAARRAYAKQILTSGECRYRRAAGECTNVYEFLACALWAGLLAKLIVEVFGH